MVLVVVVGGLRLSSVGYERSCARSPPAKEFVTVGDVQLHYAEAGQGQPVVLLHGDGGSLMDFTMSPVFDRLAERYRVVAFDRPGHGSSEAGGHADSLLEQASLLREAVAVLGLADPVVVGHSRGASVMAAYLNQHPDEVAAAVSLGGAMLADGDPPRYTFYRPGAWPVIGPLLVDTVYAPVVRFNDHAVLRASLDSAFAPDGPASGAYVRAYACQWVNPATIRTTYGLAQYTYRVLLRISQGYPHLHVPLVIVHGDADGNVDAAEVVRLHAAVPRSQLRMVPGAGHELQFTRPDEVVDAIHDAVRLRRLPVPGEVGGPAAPGALTGAS